MYTDGDGEMEYNGHDCDVDDYDLHYCDDNEDAAIEADAGADEDDEDDGDDDVMMMHGYGC